jgi:hypothetical protein
LQDLDKIRRAHIGLELRPDIFEVFDLPLELGQDSFEFGAFVRWEKCFERPATGFELAVIH